MAQLPTDAEVKETLDVSKSDDEAKLKAQEAEGKTFENNGQGVMPEEVWKNLPGKVEAK